MLECYITFRSITRAQRARSVLNTERVPNRLVRAPKALSEQGCAYALLVQEENAVRAARILREKDVPFEHIMQRRPDGRMEEYPG